MTRNNKSSKAETLIVLILFLVGAFGAFYLFSGSDQPASGPEYAIEAPSEIAQVSNQEVYR